MLSVKSQIIKSIAGEMLKCNHIMKLTDCNERPSKRDTANGKMRACILISFR